MQTASQQIPANRHRDHRSRNKLARTQNVGQTLSGIRSGRGQGGNLTLTLAGGNGTMSLGTTSGLTVTGNGSGLVTFTGTTTHLNIALARLVYQGSHDFSGADTLYVTLSTGGISSNTSVAIDVMSIAQQDANLKNQVNALQTAGILTTKQANILLAVLSLQGKIGDSGKMKSFLNDVVRIVVATSGPLVVAGHANKRAACRYDNAHNARVVYCSGIVW